MERLANTLMQFFKPPGSPESLEIIAQQHGCDLAHLERATRGRLLDSGQIAAIRYLRQETGAPLASAKKYVDQMIAASNYKDDSEQESNHG